MKQVAEIGKTAASHNGAEFYAFMAVCLILGLAGIFLWYQSKALMKKKPPEIQPKLEPKRSHENPCRELTQLEQVFGSELKLAMTDIQGKLDNVLTDMSGKFALLNHRMEDNEKHKAERRESLERAVREGFSEVHDRIDQHVAAHAEGKFTTST